MQHAIASEYISIDESSFYHRLIPFRAWSKVGERVHLPNQRIVSKRYTLLSAITSEGLLIWDFAIVPHARGWSHRMWRRAF